MSDNPFDEPVDQDRTVIRPAPGGKRGAAAAQAPPAQVPSVQALAPRPAAPLLSVDAVELGANGLVAAAWPLLQLLARLRNTANPPEALDLRARVVEQLQRFEASARGADIAMEQLRPAHFALCASLDDVVLNTPWGTGSGWAASPLVASFHPALTGDTRFFDVLDRQRRQQAANVAVIELMYFCLSLGFMGHLRDRPAGAAELEAVRGDLAREIAALRPAPAAGLSAQWRGVAAPFRARRSRLPIWVVLSACLAAIGAIYATGLADLNATSDALTARALAVPPARMPDIARAALAVPPPPAPHAPGAADRLRAALAGQKLVTLDGTDTAPVIRLPAAALFVAGTARLSAAAGAVLDPVAAALHGEAGKITVLGFTDDTQIRSVQFPSNFRLSTARAKAVQSLLQRKLGAKRAVAAEGRGEADPVGDNRTAEGRAMNQRIEIALQPESLP